MHYFFRNYRMNAKVHNFSIRLHVLSRTTQAQFPSFTFMALYSRRPWMSALACGVGKIAASPFLESINECIFPVIADENDAFCLRGR